jgi:diaminopimelate decarboxylase
MDKKYFIELSGRYGTPLFVIDLDKIKENFLRFKKAFGDEAIISYSYKTNYYPQIIKLIDRLGGNPEVVSFMELQFAKKVSKLNKAIFNGPAKTKEELEFAIKNNIFFINIDNLDELNLLETIAKKLGKKVNVGLRLNPEIDVKGKVSFAVKDSKLGMKKQNFIKAIRIIKASKNLNLRLIHSHIGTQIISPKSYIQVLGVVKKLIDEEKLNIDYIDLGGGFANETTLNKNGFSIINLAKEIIKEKKKLRLNQKLIFEPGRHIVEDGCFFISKIMAIKENWIILDVGTNHLIPLMSADYKIRFFDKIGNNKYDFAGNLCFGADVIAKGIKSPNLKVGDILQITNCGAYTLSMSEQFIYPFPTVIVKERGKYKLSLKRKTPQEVFKFWD